MFASDLKRIQETYYKIYEDTDLITEEMIDEVVDELVEELVEEGYDEEEAYSLVEEATDTYIDEAKVTFGHDTQATRKSGAPVGARRRYGMRKAGEAVKAAKGAVDTAKKKAAGVAAGAAIAGSIAKDEARRAGRKAVHSATKAADAVKRAPGEAKKKAKSGIKGFIKRQAQKVVSRMSEEYDEPRMHAAAKRVMQTQGRPKGMAASGLHSKYSMRSKGNVAGETDGPGPNAPKRSGRKGRGAGTDRGSGNKAKRRMGEEFESVTEMNAGPSTPVKMDSHMGRLVPNQGAGRPANVRLKTPMGLKKGGTVKAEEVEFDVYDVVLEYLMSDGHASTLEEAHYIMSQMDADHIQGILEQSYGAPGGGAQSTSHDFKTGNPNAVPKPPVLPKPEVKKKPEPKLGAGTPGFGYGVGTGP